MSRVDFYILPEQGGQDRRHFACALVQKAWKAGNRVCLLAGNREQAAAMDDQLWTWRDVSFIPHALIDTEDAANVPVLISWSSAASEQNSVTNADVLINVTDELPPTANKFVRIAEIVGGSTGERQAARERYRLYRDQGHELHNHSIEST